ILVLVILAIPPILAGAYAGVEAVDRQAVDAARGMGMVGHQVLLNVELPCALPLMLGGLRSAALQVIATATLAASVSLGGLGRFLIDGQAYRDYGQMAGGAVLVAALAMVVDVVFVGFQRLVVSPGLTSSVVTRRGLREHLSTN
ncbi:MAG TPA: ABC transporter permease, partial [Propionibacteriaceae bacterium]|nr:ABC transporter permease [Propionibacteriaceae bacterium]